MPLQRPDSNAAASIAIHSVEEMTGPAHRPLSPSWYALQEAKSGQINIQQVQVHGLQRTRQYLLDRELQRCKLAETLEQLEEQLEDAVEALMELGVFVAVDALIDEADTV